MSLKLTASAELEMDCAKDIVIWNYYDHEHVVGTHYKQYTAARVIAEKDDWCLVERSYRIPIFRIKNRSLGMMYRESEDIFRSLQYGAFGTVFYQKLWIKEIDADRCLVGSSYEVEIPKIFKPVFPVIQKLFQRMMKKWFHAVWEEDAPMRLRRAQVLKLGFRDFVGIDYINRKTQAPEKPNVPLPKLILPVAKPLMADHREVKRPFSRSQEVGYGLPAL